MVNTPNPAPDPLISHIDEAHLLGCLLYFPQHIVRVRGILRDPRVFSNPEYRQVWIEMLKQFETATSIAPEHRFDVSSLASALTRSGIIPREYEELRTALAYIQTETSDMFAAERYAEQIADLAARRFLRDELSERLKAQALDLSKPLPDSIRGTQNTLHGVFERLNSKLAAEQGAAEQVEDWAENPGHIRGLRTGFEEMDRFIGGLDTRSLVVLFGRQNSGKSTMLGHFTLSFLETGARGLIVPTEMTKKQWQIRIGAQLLGVSYDVLRRGEYRNAARRREIMAYTESLPVVYIENPNPTGREVYDAALANEVDFVIVDTLNKMAPPLPNDPAFRGKTEHDVVAANITILQQLQYDLNKVVMVACQPNKDSYTETSYRELTISDARGAPMEIFAEATHYFIMDRPGQLVDIGALELGDLPPPFCDNKDLTRLKLVKDRFTPNVGKYVDLEFVRKGDAHGFYPANLKTTDINQVYQDHMDSTEHEENEPF